MVEVTNNTPQEKNQEVAHADGHDKHGAETTVPPYKRDDFVPAVPLDTKLEHSYTVWAMVKQQKPNGAHLSELYVTDNKDVAHFSTVSLTFF